jgi:uncharacterized protein with PhoU and TrkA domain
VKLREGDILILQGEPEALEKTVGAAKLKLVRDEAAKEVDAPSDEIGVMEAIVTPDSLLVEATPLQLRLYDHYQVNLLAVSRSGRRISHQLRNVRFQPGDVIVLQGDLTKMPETLGALRVLPLAERISAGDCAGRGDGAGRRRTAAGRHRLLRRRRRIDADPLALPARGL